VAAERVKANSQSDDWRRGVWVQAVYGEKPDEAAATVGSKPNDCGI